MKTDKSCGKMKSFREKEEPIPMQAVYEKKNEEKPQKHVILPKIYSYGIYRYLCYVRWYLQKRTKRQGTHSTGYSSYADDMNHLYYKSSKNAKI